MSGVFLFYMACYVIHLKHDLQLPLYMLFEMQAVQSHTTYVHFPFVITYQIRRFCGQLDISSINSPMPSALCSPCSSDYHCWRCKHSLGWSAGPFSINHLWHRWLCRLGSAYHWPDTECQTYTWCCSYKRGDVCVRMLDVVVTKEATCVSVAVEVPSLWDHSLITVDISQCSHAHLLLSRDNRRSSTSMLLIRILPSWTYKSTYILSGTFYVLWWDITEFTGKIHTI